ncbi:MAG TPA: hypothetical protein VKF81_12325 [Blastocatellia bacterium]|nr:hypothetical protein [Blastocatellia bacterium]
MFGKAFWALLAVACLSLQAMTRTTPQEHNKLSLDERLGADDGAALAILFGANMRGNLDTCD